MKGKLLIIFFFLFLACQREKKNNKSVTQTDLNIDTLGYSLDSFQLQSILKETFHQSELITTKLQQVCQPSISALKFEEADTSSYTLIQLFNKQHNKGLSLKLSDIHFFSTPDESCYFSGLFKGRDQGFLVVYKVEEDKVIKVFDSGDLCDGKGIRIFNASLDCISYTPFYLTASRVDMNADGIIDFIFRGTVNSYCEGLERGFGRSDRLPLQTENVEILFLSKYLKPITTWYLADTSICNKLNLH